MSTEMAVAIYRNLLRSTRIAFQGDSRMLLAARAQARQRFESNRSLDPQGPEYTAALEEAEGVCTILRQNVVQGTSGEEGEKFKLRIHEETERGDNDTVKGAGAGKVGGVKCCSS